MRKDETKEMKSADVPPAAPKTRRRTKTKMDVEDASAGEMSDKAKAGEVPEEKPPLKRPRRTTKKTPPEEEAQPPLAGAPETAAVEREIQPAAIERTARGRGTRRRVKPPDGQEAPEEEAPETTSPAPVTAPLTSQPEKSIESPTTRRARRKTPVEADAAQPDTAQVALPETSVGEPSGEPSGALTRAETDLRETPPARRGRRAQPRTQEPLAPPVAPEGAETREEAIGKAIPEDALEAREVSEALPHPEAPPAEAVVPGRPGTLSGVEPGAESEPEAKPPQEAPRRPSPDRLGRTISDRPFPERYPYQPGVADRPTPPTDRPPYSRPEPERQAPRQPSRQYQERPQADRTDGRLTGRTANRTARRTDPTKSPTMRGSSFSELGLTRLGSGLRKDRIRGSARRHDR